MPFENKVAVVTGGAQGIGKAYSLALLDIGMKVCVVDVNEVPALQFIKTISSKYKENIFFYKCDVTVAEELKDAFDKTLGRFGTIDVVVNNAGACDESNFKRIIDINIVGVIHGIQLAFQYMGTDKGGAGGYIVNTASVAGLNGFDISPVYSGSKHAVVGLTKSYGSEYYFKKSGIKVCAVCPGPVDTFLFNQFEHFCVDAQVFQELKPSFKPIKPEEAAKALIKILNDGRNGALLRVDDTGLQYVINTPQSIT